MRTMSIQRLLSLVSAFILLHVTIGSLFISPVFASPTSFNSTKPTRITEQFVDTAAVTLSGTVTNASGEGVAGATVVLSDKTSHHPTKTDQSGRYSFTDVQRGSVIVAAIKGNTGGAIKVQVSSDQPIEVATIVLSSSSSQNINLPTSGDVQVNFISTGSPGDQTACTGDFGTQTPSQKVIYPNYLYYAGVPFALGSLGQGTELVFYITPRSFCAGTTYLSTDAAHAVIMQPDMNTWIIGWEDYSDADFNDLVVRIELQPKTLPFLELPYDYTGSSFADESKDTEQGGKVNAYFDHQYPTYCVAPNTGGCSSGDTRAVNFHGYDGGQASPPAPYKVAYNGHDGIDYRLGEGTPVLAAASGTATAYEHPCSGKTVSVLHENGYVTLYYHLSAFPAGVNDGTTFNVTRHTIGDINGLVGYVGDTGSCSDGTHLHFLVRNPAGVQVDPYGWKPSPHTTWYGKTDPWQQYKADTEGIDGTSYYLWKQSSAVAGLVPTSGTLVMTSASGHVQVTVPSNAYNGALRMELAHTFAPARIPGFRSLQSFTLFGFTTNDVVVTNLGTGITLDVYTQPKPTMQFHADSSPVPPTLHVWNAQSATWQQLPTTWDSATGHAQATSSRIGEFALSIAQPSIYLPLVSKD